MASGPCDFFAILTTSVVYATFFGPPIVALSTLYMFHKSITEGKSNWKPSRLMTFLFMLVPWCVGLGMGIAAQVHRCSMWI